MLINVGYGNIVNMDKVVSIVRTEAAPILIMDSGHIVLSALLPDTIENRVNENQNREEQSQ